MPDNALRNYQEWLYKASEDELNLLSLLKHRDGTPSGACFFEQQMAEKLLKAITVKAEIELVKTHDLMELETIIAPIAPGIKTLHDDLNYLNQFYVETRYSADYPEFTWDEAVKGLEAVLRVKEFVLKQLE